MINNRITNPNFVRNSAPPAAPSEEPENTYGPLASATRDVVTMVGGVGGAILNFSPGVSEGAAEAALSNHEMSDATRNLARSGISTALLAATGFGVAHFTADLDTWGKLAAGAGNVVQGGVVLNRMGEEKREALRSAARNAADALTPDEIPGGQFGKIAYSATARAVAGGVAGGFEAAKDGFRAGEEFAGQMFDETALLFGVTPRQSAAEVAAEKAAKEAAVGRLQDQLGETFDPASVAHYSAAQAEAFADRNDAFRAKVDAMPAHEQVPYLRSSLDDLGSRIEAARKKHGLA